MVDYWELGIRIWNAGPCLPWWHKHPAFHCDPEQDQNQQTVGAFRIAQTHPSLALNYLFCLFVFFWGGGRVYVLACLDNVLPHSAASLKLRILLLLPLHAEITGVI